jgi:uncharacterized protein YbaR (Trm112 family)
MRSARWVRLPISATTRHPPDWGPAGLPGAYGLMDRVQGSILDSGSPDSAGGFLGVRPNRALSLIATVPRPKLAAAAAHEFPLAPAVTLVCPSCRSSLLRQGARFVCRDRDCRRAYPIKDGIPLFLVQDAAILDEEDWLTIAAS